MQKTQPSQAVRAHRATLKEMLRGGNNKTLIHMFEQSEIENKQDPESLSYYIQALEKDGQSGDILKKLAALDNTSPPPRQQTTPLSLDGENYLLKIGENSDAKASHSNVAMKKLRSKTSDNTSGEPIHVVLTKKFSWMETLRTLSSKLFLGICALLGVSFLLNQQGILKTAMNSQEPQPQSQESIKVRFSDVKLFKQQVQGVDEAKQELEEVVEFLKNPHKFMELGGKLPKGVLLYGPPGTGKTHLARAIAGEAGVPFFHMSGSEFDELYVGVGARRVRELFAAAKKRAPCIVFIDELDAVGSKRNSKDQSYMRQTLNQLLVELDGFSSNSGIIVIGATNTFDSLDKALVRPGRFDRKVPVPLPDVKGRLDILKVHMKGILFEPNADPKKIALGTPGMSGADLANLVNQAAIKAAKDRSKYVTSSHLEWAKDKIQLGTEWKSKIIREEEKLMTAYHEGGHALAALFTKGAIPLHKVTVIPRGNALGLTYQLPDDDIRNRTRQNMFAELDVCMGGRVAEELIYGSESGTSIN